MNANPIDPATVQRHTRRRPWHAFPADHVLKEFGSSPGGLIAIVALSVLFEQLGGGPV